MIRKNDSFGGTVYVPDPIVPNNQLNNSYFLRLGLANMTFDQAYDMIAKIYDAIGSKCRGPNCTCYNSYLFHDYDDHSLMFMNVTIMTQSKRIVSTFIDKFARFTFSDSIIKQGSDNGGFVYPMALISFAIKFDYSLERLYMYNISSDEFFYKWGMYNANQNLTVFISFLRNK